MARPPCRHGGPGPAPQLLAELALVRTRGWAENLGESEAGVSSIAAPIRNARGEVIAAVSAAGPTMRVSGDSLRGFFRASVVNAADAISARLGHRPDRRVRGQTR